MCRLGDGESGRPKAPLTLTDDERAVLERWARRPKSAQALALRSKIVLACAEGTANKEVAGRFGVTPQMVGKWRARFVASGWMAWPMSRGPGSRGRSPMSGSRR